MRVLMIGFDSTMLEESPQKPSDTKERHCRYVQALREKYPLGELIVILKVPPSRRSVPVQLAEGFTVYPVPSCRTTFLAKAWETLKRINPEKFDLITTQTPFDDGWLGVKVKEKYKIPLNVQIHSSFLDNPYWLNMRPLMNRILNILGKLVIRKADTIRVVSIGERRRLISIFPFLEKKLFYLPPYFNLKLLGQPVNTDSLNAKFSGKVPPYIFFSGRLAKEKNIPLLLKAFALVRKERKGVF
ncbi:MAG TPA: hypothetical protein ENG13_00005, partial [bacterium]|nr:hypothetical protein [bacterium]HEX67438.1 hypothetical protein [bacterium]